MNTRKLTTRRNGCLPAQGRCTRRDALRHLGSGTLLALGLWPGALRADTESPSGSFRFIVINDTHCLSPQCGTYLQGAVRQMQKEDAELLLHAGDLTDQGDAQYFELVKDLFRPWRGAFWPVIGNHDYRSDSDRTAYTKSFPEAINYSFTHRGWQFIALDTTEGTHYQNTLIPTATLRWLDEHLPKLNPRRPTVILTHFPLGVDVNYRPRNADALLDRFLDFNLQAVFSGHYHAFTERISAGVVLTTNRCCSFKRNNHDGSKEKGYFLCGAQDGRILRSFVEYRG